MGGEKRRPATAATVQTSIQIDPTSKLEVTQMKNLYRPDPTKANKTRGGAGYPASSQSPYLAPSHIEADREEIIGISPSRIPLSDILALGHPTSPIKAIRAKCLDCCSGSEAEARKCVVTACPLWPLRMGRNVYHANARR